MSQDNERHKTFTRRAIMAGGVQLGLLGALVSRLYYLQIIESSKYRTLAEENRISTRLQAPRRGQIIDRNGKALATNDQNFQAILVGEQSPDPETTIAAFSKIVPLTDEDIEKILHDLRHNKSFTPVLICDELNWDQVARIGLQAPDLPGISIETGYRRTYLFAEKGAPHILGYVGPPSDDETDDSPLLRLPGFRIGKSGVERAYDDSLRGTPGDVQLEVNAHGRVVRELGQHPAIPGKDLSLALDISYQQFAQARLSQEISAAATVLDVHTGAVYAMASHPAYDPNIFTAGLSSADWESLSNNEAAPLINKVTAGQYAPGSTFKMATALAGLESGLIDPNAKIICDGTYTLGDHIFHCYKRGGHGAVDLHDGIMYSCDVFFYDLAHKIGIDRIQDMAQRLGIGSKTGIDLPGEHSGFMPGRVWKRAHSPESWQQGETLNTAIGQGRVLATPLQIAVMAAQVVNGGKSIRPWIAKDANVNKAPSVSLGINPASLQRVVDGMIAVVENPRGTAHAMRIPVKGFEMGGKSGSAQVRHISMAEREHGVIPNDDLPWKERENALFVGFAPINDPRYVASVIVEHGGSGSKAAAPIARDLLWEAQKRQISV